MPMIGAPRRPEIDEYTIKFLVGAIALSLPVIELILTRGSITSISESFWIPDPEIWPRNFFVGFLFAIAAFLLAYNGKSEGEMWLGKAACVSAFGVAMFPCACGRSAAEIIRGAHFWFAAILFVVLGCFCVIFLHRAQAKGHREALRRAGIYRLCGLGMVVALVLFVVRAFTDREALVFWAETLGLVSFGLSWLTASKVLPGITEANERRSLVVRTATAQTPVSPASPTAGAVGGSRAGASP